MSETSVICGLMVYQDNSRIRCYLPLGHAGPHKEAPVKYQLSIEPAKRRIESWVEDESMREVSRGDGFVHIVPAWIAEAIERGWVREG